MLRIVGVMRLEALAEEMEKLMYLFDAQNRWGYEIKMRFQKAS